VFESRSFGARDLLVSKKFRPAARPTQTFSEQRGLFSLELDRSGREADHSPTSTAEVKYVCVCVCVCMYIYTGCPRRNELNFGRVFPMLNYTDITQNTYIQS